MRFRLLLLDLDGTLLDTLADIAHAANGALQAAGFPAHPADDYRRLVGRGPRALFEQALPPAAGDPAVIERVMRDYLARYAACGHAHTRIYPGIEALLDGAVAAGLKLGVLSNKVHAETRTLVPALFPRHPWAALQGLEPRFPAKPDPASGLALCRDLGLAPAEVLYVGDSDVDMHLARAANFFACGAAWGFRGAGELRAAGAAAVCARPEDALGLLG